MTLIAPETVRSPEKEGQHRRTHGLLQHSSWQLLREDNFRRYFVGSLASNLGTWLQNTAQVLLAYQFTRSVFAVALIVSAQFAGTLLVSPWAAVLANWIGNKVTLVGTQGVSAVIAGSMAALSAAGMLGEHILILGATGLGLAFAFALPVQSALVPTLVNASDSEAAMEMNSVSYNAGRALAPALCVPVIAFIGPTPVFAINAASFAIFAVILARLEPAAADGDRSARLTGTWRQPMRRVRVTDGFRIALYHQRLLLLLAIVAAVTIADDPVLVLSPALARTILHTSGNWAGFFIAALGWGTVLGSLQPIPRRQTAARNAAKYAPSKRAARSLLVLGVSVIVFALGLSVAISLSAAFIAGAAALRTGAAAQTAIVTRDRTAAASIAALWAIAWAGTKPVASLLDGWLASRYGILATAIMLATPALIIALCELGIRPERKKKIKDWARKRKLVKYLRLDPSQP